MKNEKELLEKALEETKKQNQLEDRLALERYGVKYDKLEYDEKEEITFLYIFII